MKQETREARGHCPWQKYAAAYTDGTLSPKKTERMREHLGCGCALCDAALAAEKRLRTVCAAAVSAPSAAQMQSMEDRILATVRSEALLIGAKEKTPSRTHKWRTVCGVAAALVFVIGLVPTILTTADNAAKESSGNCAFDQMENAVIGNEKGEAAPNADGKYPSKGDSLNEAFGEAVVETNAAADALGDQAPMYAATGEVESPYDVEADAVVSEAVSTQSTTSSAVTNNECEEECGKGETESYQMYVRTLIVDEADVNEAFDLLNAIATANNEAVTEEKEGWSVSGILYEAFCNSLKDAGITYRITVTEEGTKDSAQNGRLYLSRMP